MDWGCRWHLGLQSCSWCPNGVTDTLSWGVAKKNHYRRERDNDFWLCDFPIDYTMAWSKFLPKRVAHQVPYWIFLVSYFILLFFSGNTIHLVSYSMCPGVVLYLNFGFSSKVLIFQVLILTPQTENNFTNQLVELKRRIASFFSIRSLLDICLREQASRLFLHENIVCAQ